MWVFRSKVLVVRLSPLYLLAGYIIGAMFSEHIFIDMSATHWANLWVYLWIFLWPFCLLGFFFKWTLIIGLSALFCWWLWTQIKERL